MKHTKQRIIALTTRVLTAVTVLVLSLVIYLHLVASAPKPQVTDAAESIRKVTVLPAKKRLIQRQWSGYATAKALDSVNIPARLTATVASLPSNIHPGASVNTGQLLIELDNRDFLERVEVARHQRAELNAQLLSLDAQEDRAARQLKLDAQDVELADRELQRIKQMYDRGAAHSQEIDRAIRAQIAAQRTKLLTEETLMQIQPRRDQVHAQIAAAKAQQHLALLDLERCRIVCPIDGVLQSVDVEPGESVVNGQLAARIVDPSRIEVPIRLPASARSTLAVGDPVELTTTSRPVRRWSTQVDRIGPEDNPDTRTFTVYALIDQSSDLDNDASKVTKVTSPRLAPGLFLAATVSSGPVEPRWLAPRRSVNQGRVLLVDNGRVASLPVEIDYTLERRFPDTGVNDDQWAVINAPLTEGALILLNASASLLDGQEVQPSPIEPKADADPTRSTAPREASP